ncbi:hypothetical protein F0342_07215 [Bacillus sp. CH30_1T]|uniref:hypothetical protein n=1 Tax=Bacillus sp. CH30_1T TaxID=2604836 RepID=UPI0012580E87|nr:hypothetical protein [Bacillus sp. CH30_1T]KAA0565387.1 hypothetical protein F0342_07215 [Bacillus sp. CH30_1T]
MTKHSKLMKSSLAVLVAGSISFSGSLAYANNDEKTFDTVTIEQKDSTGVTVNDEAMIDSAKTEIEKLEKKETPSLLPGDFFYFAKLALEKVKLAFTMDDAKEAKLVAEYAAERLAEVEALFEEGKEEEAIEAINHAIEMIQRSGEELPHGENEEASNDDSMKESAGETEDESNTEEENSETEQTKDGNEEGTVEEADSEEKSDEMTEMEELMSQNIISLKANLEKVKNPKAKAALQKNIEKSYMKLAEKLAKLEGKSSKKANAQEETESDESMKDDSVTPVEESVANDSTTDENTDENKTVASPTVKKETEKTTPVKVQHVEKEVKKELKQQQKQVKKEGKEVLKQMKNEEKQARHDVKEEKKQHHPAAKQKEHQGQNRESGKENGKGHNKD